MILYNFLYFHYKAWFSLFTFYITFIHFLYHYFSIGILVKTLFAPWKRETSQLKDIFPLDQFFEALSFNLTSRIIGFIIRFLTVILGTTSIFFALVAGLIILIAFPCLPFISLPFYLLSRKKTLLEHIDCEKHTSKDAFFHLFNSTQGRFIIDRLNIDNELFAKMASSLPAALPEEFKDAKKLSTAFFILANNWHPFKKFLADHQITPQDVREVASWFETLEEKRQKHQLWDLDSLLRIPGIGHDWAYGYTVNLDRYTYPISSRQNPLGPIHGREKELEKMEDILIKLFQNSLFLIGDTGTGRHALVERFSDMIISGYTLPQLRYKRVLGLSADLLLTEAREKDISLSFEQILKEAESAGNIIVVIDAIERYICPDARSNLSDIFAQATESGRLQLIGITTNEYFRKCIEPNKRLTKNFSIVEVEGIEAKKMLGILKRVVPIYERRYGIIFTYQSLGEIIKATDKLYPDLPFPQKAVEAVDLVASQAVRLTKSHRILADDVDQILSKVSKIPYGRLKASEKEKLVNLEGLLYKRIVNQKQAINSIVSALRRSRLKLKTEKKPIGSFLFLGPTGVGKTETAKALADVYFASEKSMIRFDMSQFHTDDSLSRLIGDVQENQPGELTSAVREQPFSVVLLDEFEKASYKIHHLFLTVFDEGYLTDGFGKKSHFDNNIIIVTSNAGAGFIREKVNEAMPMDILTRELIEKILKDNIFTPELINRFDAVVVYQPLTEENLRKIARMMLEKLSSNLKKEHQISLKITAQLIEKVVKKGYDPAFGARPMRRAISELVEDKIAQMLLTDNIKPGKVINLGG